MVTMFCRNSYIRIFISLVVLLLQINSPDKICLPLFNKLQQNTPRIELLLSYHMSFIVCAVCVYFVCDYYPVFVSFTCQCFFFLYSANFFFLAVYNTIHTINDWLYDVTQELITDLHCDVTTCHQGETTSRETPLAAEGGSDVTCHLCVSGLGEAEGRWSPGRLKTDRDRDSDNIRRAVSFFLPGWRALEVSWSSLDVVSRYMLLFLQRAKSISVCCFCFQKCSCEP